jgi:hypothetical protein
MLRVLAGVVILGMSGGGYALWPVCAAIPATDLPDFKPPISERTERGWYGQVFQRHGDQWYQCKTRIARAYFF